jgi:hypothetical protein
MGNELLLAKRKLLLKPAEPDEKGSAGKSMSKFINIAM